MEENNIDQNNQDVVTLPTEIVATLPSFKSCVTDSWEFVKARFDLVLLVLIATLPSLYMSIMDARTEQFMQDNQGLSAIITLWSFITSPLVSWIVLYSVLYRQESPSLRSVVTEHLPRHILPVFWLVILTTLVVFGGLVLLIVPAIILGIYMTFSTAVLVAEDKRGLSALLRSHQLVSGFWLAIAGRIVGVALLWGLVSMIVAAFGEVGMIVSGVVQAVTMVAILFVVATLYQARKASFAPEAATPPRRLYQAIASLGLFTILSGVVIAGYYFLIFAGISF